MGMKILLLTAKNWKKSDFLGLRIFEVILPCTAVHGRVPVFAWNPPPNSPNTPHRHCHTKFHPNIFLWRSDESEETFHGILVFGIMAWGTLRAIWKVSVAPPFCSSVLPCTAVHGRLPVFAWNHSKSAKHVTQALPHKISPQYFLET